MKLNLDFVRESFPTSISGESKLFALEEKITCQKDILSVYKLLTRSMLTGRLDIHNGTTIQSQWFLLATVSYKLRKLDECLFAL